MSCQIYILLSEVRLEEEEEYKSYLRIIPEYFDELFEILKDGITKKLQRSQLDQKCKVDLKIYDVTAWSTGQRSKGNQAMKSGQVVEDIKTNIFLHKSCRK